MSVDLHFHVTSDVNRQSIQEHGLDWTQMALAPGIAGSRRPEQDGIFLADSEWICDFFIRMNAPDTPLDVWAVRGVDPDDLIEVNGFCYVPRRIPVADLQLVCAGVRHDGSKPFAPGRWFGDGGR